MEKPKGILKNSKVGSTWWETPPLAGQDFPPEPEYETPSPPPTIRRDRGTVKTLL